MKSSESVLKDFPLYKALLVMGIPAVGAMLLNSLNNLIDKFYLGRIGTEAIAANTLYLPIVILATGIPNILIQGGGAYIGRKLGGQDRDSGNKAFTTVLALNSILAIVEGVLIVLFIDKIAIILNVPTEVLPSFKLYAIPMSLGLILFVLLTNLGDFLRAQGNTLPGFLGVFVGVIGNIAFTPILAFTLGLGILGVAFGTLISGMLGILVMFYFHTRPNALLKWDIKKISFDINFLKSIAVSGFPGFIASSGYAISIAIGGYVASIYGVDPVASFGLAISFIITPLFILWGIGNAASAIGAYAYGNKNYQRLRSTFKVGIIFGFIFVIIPSYTYFVYGANIVGFFAPGQEQVIIMTSTFLKYYAIILFLSPISESFMFFSIATGKGLRGGLFTGITVLSVMFFTVTLHLFMGPIGVLMSYFFSEIVAFTAVIAFVMLGKESKYLLLKRFDELTAYIDKKEV